MSGMWAGRRRRRAVPEAPPSRSTWAGEGLPQGAAEVLGVLSSAAIVVDAVGRVVSASPAAFAFGLVRSGELVHAELQAMAVDARSLRLVRERELTLARGPLGRGRLTVLARVAPLGPADDGLVLLLVDDRTEAQRLEEVRRDFVANVSHELKTPVGALSLLAEAVEDAADDPDMVRHFARRMHREARRLADLVKDIIDLSRLQVADALHPPEPVDVDAMVADAVDRCRLVAEARRIAIVVGGDTGAVVYGDHDLLLTAVRNLIDNAVAYSPEDTHVSVGIRRCAGDLVEIAVSDRGIGIPAAERSRIFERFYRVDQARSRATGGTGLGLSIVKHVATTHGGEVRLWSVEGQGSTFTLRLPESGHALPGSGPDRPPEETEAAARASEVPRSVVTTPPTPRTPVRPSEPAPPSEGVTP